MKTEAQERTGVPTHPRAPSAHAAPGATIIVAMLAFALVPAPARAQDAGAILDRASAAYAHITTLRMNFVQEVADPMIGGAEPSRGEFLQQRPGKFAMRWTEPKGDLLVADGEYLWVYLPSSTPNQVVRTRISGRGGESADVIAEFLERPRERFAVAYARAEATGGREADVLTLTPLDRNAAYSRVLVWVDRQDALVRKIEIGEASGAVRRLTFDHLRPNAAIPASAFTFRPPAGVRVVDASN